MRAVALFLTTAFIVGCAGKVDYVRPSIQSAALSNSKIVDRPRDAVWNASVPALGKRFFVINNLDKSSGLINLSYSGDPEKYVDCGRVSSYVQNLQGERTYSFAGSAAQQTYEVMNSNRLFSIDRKMSLEGRVNLIFEEVGPSQTRVTANTRYVLNRQQTVRSVGNDASQTLSHTISFNFGGGASFPPNSNGQAVECMSTGALEGEILSAIR
jgi:hypothetical protein